MDKNSRTFYEIQQNYQISRLSVTKGNLAKGNLVHETRLDDRTIWNLEIVRTHLSNRTLYTQIRAVE